MFFLLRILSKTFFSKIKSAYHVIDFKILRNIVSIILRSYENLNIFRTNIVMRYNKKTFFIIFEGFLNERIKDGRVCKL